MKKTIIASCVALVTASAIALLLVQLLTFDGIPGLSLYLSGADNTTYASNYTDRAFSSLREGMLEDEVRKRLGEPLFIGKSEQTYWWTYTSGRRRRELFVIHGKVADIMTGLSEEQKIHTTLIKPTLAREKSTPIKAD